MKKILFIILMALLFNGCILRHLLPHGHKHTNYNQGQSRMHGESSRGDRSYQERR